MTARILTEYCFRAVIISCGAQFITFKCLDMVFSRSRRVWPAYLYMLCKTFIMAASMLLTENAAENRTIWFAANTIIQCVFSAGVYLAFAKTWSEDPLHLLLIMIIAETTISFPVSGISIIINKLEGRPINMVSGPIYPLDFLNPLIMIACFYIARSVIRIVMSFLSRLYLPQRKLLWGVVFIVYLVSTAPSVLGNKLSDVGDLTYGLMFLIAAIHIAGLLLLIMYLIMLQDNEKLFLSMQIGLIGRRARAMQHIRGEVEESRHLLLTQMKELEMYENRGQQPTADVIAEYLAQLKNVKQKEYRGVYCSDLLVDEVLLQIRNRAVTNGLETRISLDHYALGNIREEDLVRLLYCIGYSGAGREPKRNSLPANLKTESDEVKERMEIMISASGHMMNLRFCAPSIVIPRRRVMFIREIVRKYKGTFSQYPENGKQVVFINLHKE